MADTVSKALLNLYTAPLTDNVFNPNAPDPWERMESETTEAYNAFRYYLKLPRRTFRAVVQYIYSKYVTEAQPPNFEEMKPTNELAIFDPKVFDENGLFNIERHNKLKEIEDVITSWSMAYKWQERADQYDMYTNETENVRKALFRRKMVWKHLEVTESMMTVIQQRLEDMDPTELEVDDIAKWLKIVVDVQRISLDQSTSNQEVHKVIEHTGNVNVTGNGLSAQDIKRVIESPDLLDSFEHVIEGLMEDQSGVVRQSIESRQVDTSEALTIDIPEDS